MVKDKRRNRVRHVAGRKMDYRSPSDMALAAAVQKKRRGDATTHPYVLGCFLHDSTSDTIVLYAASGQPGAFTPAALTSRQRSWYRWRTKQAAHQWLKNHKQWVELLVLNLDSLRTFSVLPPFQF